MAKKIIKKLKKKVASGKKVAKEFNVGPLTRGNQGGNFEIMERAEKAQKRLKKLRKVKKTVRKSKK